MCTVSWVHRDDGYDLLCNRDEKRTRARASGPQFEVRNGVHFVAPVDGDFGGSWIGVNELGISVCLMNGTNLTAGAVWKPESGRSYRSRGLLVLDLFNAESVIEVSERLWRLDLSCFAAFTLVALEAGEPATIIEWNGAEKAIVPFGEPYMPLVSSSFDATGVRARRLEEFARTLGAAGELNADTLSTFHASHGSCPDAYSPCMHRHDAETVSFSWIRVNETDANFYYSPTSLCRYAPGLTRNLLLKR